jgi:hypothetical protein
MKRALVVTTINNPTEGMTQLATGAAVNGIDFYVVGDVKTPDFNLGGARYYSIEDQRKLGFSLAQASWPNSYTRKNIGYLLAMQGGADVIQETDDDNIPMGSFWQIPLQQRGAERISHSGWVNVYQFFTDSWIWPRGLPLDEIDETDCGWQTGGREFVNCPIQQGLANGDPDVDAIYRLTAPGLECGGYVVFDEGVFISLGPCAWCPFNSQNTTWFQEAFPLMYLPSTCTFRMTDIWRSFIAQRILWTRDQSVLFRSPTVVQKRNAHDLMYDFRQEVPGYLNNKRIADGLLSLELYGSIPDSMRICYEWFVREGLLHEDELRMLEYWLKDIEGLQ